MSDVAFAQFVDSIEGQFRSGDLKSHEKLEENANIRLVQNLMQALARGDLAAVSALMAENVEFLISGPDELPFIRAARGPAQLIAALRQNFAAVRNQSPRIESVIAQGDTVIILMEEAGTVCVTGQDYQVKGIQRFVIRDGKIDLVEELFAPA